MYGLRFFVATVAAGTAFVSPAFAQIYQSDFPPEEFRVRWTQILDRIGGEAVAVAQGACSPTVLPSRASRTPSTT